MLVLSRKVGESILIGADIRVEVVKVRGNKVRLAIVAPPGVSVHRNEVANKIFPPAAAEAAATEAVA